MTVTSKSFCNITQNKTKTTSKKVKLRLPLSSSSCKSSDGSHCAQLCVLTLHMRSILYVWVWGRDDWRGTACVTCVCVLTADTIPDKSTGSNASITRFRDVTVPLLCWSPSIHSWKPDRTNVHYFCLILKRPILHVSHLCGFLYSFFQKSSSSKSPPKK